MNIWLKIKGRLFIKRYREKITKIWRELGVTGYAPLLLRKDKNDRHIMFIGFSDKKNLEYAIVLYNHNFKGYREFKERDIISKFLFSSMTPEWIASKIREVIEENGFSLDKITTYKDYIEERHTVWSD